MSTPTSEKIAVASGETKIIYIKSDKATVAVTPSGGASALVESTTSPPQNVVAGTASWRAWPAGTVTVPTEDALLSPATAVRCTASVSGSVDFEVSQ